jgi:hypothetical protein
MSKLTARVEAMEKALKAIRDYPTKAVKRRTKKGYPQEVAYDQFAYERMVDSYREAAIAALKP